MIGYELSQPSVKRRNAECQLAPNHIVVERVKRRNKVFGA